MKEIIFTIGLPGAGKSSIVQPLEKQGYYRLNRDNDKGSIADLHKKLDKVLETEDKVILDNTYLTLEHRAELVQIAQKHKAQITGYLLNTSFEDCQFNVCWRFENGGPEIPAIALYAAKKKFIEPTISEGFGIRLIPFHRNLPKDHVNKALILDYDGTLRTSKAGAKWSTTERDIEIIPGVVKKLQEYKDKGYILLGVSNQAPIAYGDYSEAKAIKMFEYTNKLLGFKIEYLYSKDKPMPVTYNRKPGVGLGVKHVVKHKLDPSKCIMVGDMTSDETFAKRCGFKFIHAEKFVR